MLERATDDGGGVGHEPLVRELERLDAVRVEPAAPLAVVLLHALDALVDAVEVEHRLARRVAAADPGAGRPRLPPRDALRDRVLAAEVDVPRLREHGLDHLAVAGRRPTERAQERKEALDLVPVQLEPEDSGSARVGSALLQVADGSAARPPGELRVVEAFACEADNPVSASIRASMFEPDRGVAQTRNERSIPARSIASRAWPTLAARSGGRRTSAPSPARGRTARPVPPARTPGA